ncbi:MAG TPA: bifunctional 3-phenylpropionate/cinnamic acid dioxygenase ferredoxin subunit [Microbacteriaceae bacterium]
MRICSLEDIPLGEAMRIDMVTPPIAIFHTEDDEFFALDDTCTHQNASLADGWVEDGSVECPLHASRFDLRTGEVDAPPAKRPVRAHEVSIVDGDIYVAISEAVPNLPPGTSY